MPINNNVLVMILFVFQIFIIILYGVFARFPDVSDTNYNLFNAQYSNFQGMNVMLFIGFSLLKTYLKRYSWSAIGFTFFILIFSIPYYILWATFWTSVYSNIWVSSFSIGLQQMISGLYASTAIIVTFAGILGKIGLFQLFVIILIQVFGYSLNQVICKNYLQCFDTGGGMTIHAFGAYYSISILKFLPKQNLSKHQKNSSSYDGNKSALIGMIFLWIFWPSFNSASLTTVFTRQIAIVNTVFSLIGSASSTFIFSLLYRKKLCIDDILVSSISGGVVIASGANLIINPGVPYAVGFFIGWISTSGVNYLSKYLQITGILYDTSGVNNLHGMPGILGGIMSSIYVAAYNSTYFNYIGSDFVTTLSNRSNLLQACFQLACLGTSLGISIILGLLTGWLISRTATYRSSELFQDEAFWEFIEPQEQQNPKPQQEFELSIVTNRIQQSLKKSPLHL